jgi:glycolate oxidase FAD binding subunit
MNSLQPTTAEEVQEAVTHHRRLLPVGGQTKPALLGNGEPITRLEMAALSGIIEYEPGEYTFTAYAGTPVAEIRAALDAHGQYMPFDPLQVAQGATLGGVVAANSSGSGRYRYGGVRDFIIGVTFVDGRGRLVRSGGKVVKNSAGFDLSKFMVGSMGRFGVLVSLSFKVFPRPQEFLTVEVAFPGLGTALDAIYRLSGSPAEIDVLDLEPADNEQWQLLIRMGGLPDALPGRAARMQQFLQAETGALDSRLITGADDNALWQGMNSLAWLPPDMPLVKIPVSPKRIPLLENILQPAPPPRRYTAGGNVAWLAVSGQDVATLDTRLLKLGLSGMRLLGEPGAPLLGAKQGQPLVARIKQALDPDSRFLEI